MSGRPPASFRGKDAEVQVTFAAVGLGLVASAVLVLCFWAWLISAAKAALSWGWIRGSTAADVERFIHSLGFSPRLPLVGWTPRSAVPWAVVDLVIVVGMYFVAVVAVDFGMRELGWLPDRTTAMSKLSLDERQRFMAVNMVVSVFVCLVGLLLAAIRSGASARDFGFSWREMWSDLRLGLIAFVMLAPPVYALQGLLVYFWKQSKHPVMEMFKDAPDAGFFAVLFVSAAIVAPIVEELLFRVLLQGFLEKAYSFRGDAWELFFGGRAKGEVMECSLALDSGAGPVPALPLDGNTYAPPQATLVEGTAESILAEQPELRGTAAWAPIGITSAIFAVLHFSHGPDWIPLFFLAAGMGYLYQRTHRVLPSLTVHALLNGLSMWGLWVQVQSEGLRS
jgi:membrane protease YdiL (CAAX protease family)